MDIRIIGTGSVRVNLNRRGPCYLVDMDGTPLLVDCGRCAVDGLVRNGMQVEDINHVCITHLHFDHVCDLPYFILLSWNNGRKQPLRFFGPPGLDHFLQKAVIEAFEQDITTRLGHGKDPLGLHWTVHEIDHDGQFAVIADHRLRAVRTEHAHLPHNLNFRIDGLNASAVITSDTNPCPELTALCTGADLVISECSGTHEFLTSVPWGSWHMWPEALAELAEEAGVKRVVLSHLVIENWTDNPHVADDMAATVRENCSATVLVGNDNDVLSVPAGA